MVHKKFLSTGNPAMTKSDQFAMYKRTSFIKSAMPNNCKSVPKGVVASSDFDLHF